MLLCFRVRVKVRVRIKAGAAEIRFRSNVFPSKCSRSVADTLLKKLKELRKSYPICD